MMSKGFYQMTRKGFHQTRKGFSRVRNGVSHMRKVFSRLRKGFSHKCIWKGLSNIRKGFSSMRKGFSHVRKGFSLSYNNRGLSHMKNKLSHMRKGFSVDSKSQRIPLIYGSETLVYRSKIGLLFNFRSKGLCLPPQCRPSSTRMRWRWSSCAVSAVRSAQPAPSLPRYTKAWFKNRKSRATVPLKVLKMAKEVRCEWYQSIGLLFL